jgi:hypothetical protein
MHLTQSSSRSNVLSGPEQPLPPVPDPNAWKLFVFRKSRDWLPTRRLLEDLQEEINRLRDASSSALDALVRAGELETGLADAGIDDPAIAGLVDQLASLACGNSRVTIAKTIEHRELPAFVSCAHPEGFSYYGLNPLDFADLARRMQKHLAPRIVVLGVRSVGSTLGAVVTAVWRANGNRVERTTVRPEGEPYRRTTRFSPIRLEWIKRESSSHADFVIVDEGPGFSGSTFLSVARALLGTGVPNSKIVLMCSRPFPVLAAGAELAAEWSGFRSYMIDYGTHLPAGAGTSLGGGKWRELQYPGRSCWPACWTDQERIKHLGCTGRSLFKFEGFGRYGELSRMQAGILAETGFSPPWLRSEGGFAQYEFVIGRPLEDRDLSTGVLSRMAEYCAFRVTNLPAPGATAALLREMMQVNLAVELGFDHPSPTLPLERPVYPDCRMLPHEWRINTRGLILKTDAVGHAEGHQLPGPVDIAWDLAGAIIEWQLSPEASRFFLDEYQRMSGDRAHQRAQAYLLPYAVFRMSRCRMAAEAMRGRFDANHLHNDYAAYAMKVKALLEAESQWKVENETPVISPSAA